MPDPTDRLALLVNGTVGVGKTSVADAVGAILQDRGLPGAVLDLDGLRNAWLAQRSDPFHFELTLTNLTAVAANDFAAGARCLVLAGVVESRADRNRYVAAVGVPLTMCRLRADLDVVRLRLRRRHEHDPAGLEWHQNRCAELDAILDRAGGNDFTLDTTAQTPEETALEVVRRWLG